MYMNDLIISINIKKIQKFKNYLNQELEIKYIKEIIYYFDIDFSRKSKSNIIIKNISRKF